MHSGTRRCSRTLSPGRDQMFAPHTASGVPPVLGGTCHTPHTTARCAHRKKGAPPTAAVLRGQAHSMHGQTCSKALGAVAKPVLAGPAVHAQAPLLRRAPGCCLGQLVILGPRLGVAPLHTLRTMLAAHAAMAWDLGRSRRSGDSRASDKGNRGRVKTHTQGEHLCCCRYWFRKLQPEQHHYAQ
jgi:hypothetical protein